MAVDKPMGLGPQGHLPQRNEEPLGVLCLRGFGGQQVIPETNHHRQLLLKDQGSHDAPETPALYILGVKVQKSFSKKLDV